MNTACCCVLQATGRACDCKNKQLQGVLAVLDAAVMAKIGGRRK